MQTNTPDNSEVSPMNEPHRVLHSKKTSHRKARNLALQSLYEIDLTDHAPEDVIQSRIDDNDISIGTARFLTELVDGVLNQTETLDGIIRIHAPEWPVDQLAVVERNLLRLAIYELTFDKRTTAKALINEYVELAKQFGGDATPRFINGVLGTVMESVGE